MFARKVSMRLKVNCVPRFIDRLENEILPVLRKQQGFQNQVAFVTPSGSEAFVVSFWERPENAEAFGRGAYAEIVKILETVMEGSAEVEVFHVVSTTIHKIPGPATARAAVLSAQ